MPDVTHKMIEDDDLNTFIILESLPEDSGKYECIAINQIGEARCQANLKVEGSQPAPTTVKGKPGTKEKKPKLVEPLKDLTVIEGGSALFKCKIQGISCKYNNCQKQSFLLLMIFHSLYSISSNMVQRR